MLTLHLGFDELVDLSSAAILCCRRDDEQENSNCGTRNVFCREGHDYSPEVVCMRLRMMR
jgi:hypothetical protein